MYRAPEWSYEASLKLSEVLDEIGVNENVVLKTRRLNLICEPLRTIIHRLKGMNLTIYWFGSQTEGTTTLDLCSDSDSLLCSENIKVITELKDWTPGYRNLLMIQDSTTSPGYCLLQQTMLDKPSLLCRDGVGRILFNHLLINVEAALNKEWTRQGPSIASSGEPGFCDQDYVYALRCKTWPKEAQNWLSQKGAGNWPTEEVKAFAVENGCFLVPVCSKGSAYEYSEWRISTSQAERALMFSLNITQLRCYVLMKMILKTFINPLVGGAISSYMCKTVLFHCIKNADPSIWQKNNLLTCLTLCLSVLQYCILTENCPHFIINENNLIKERVSKSMKHVLLEELRRMILSNGHFLYDIKLDRVGIRYRIKMNVVPVEMEILLSSFNGEPIITSKLLRIMAKNFTDFYENLLSDLRNTSLDDAISLTRIYIKKFFHFSKTDNRLVRAGCMLAMPSFCSTLGAMIASKDICSRSCISDVAIEWLSAGLHSDVSSGRLKLASVYFSAYDFPRAIHVLLDVKKRYNRNVVEPVCGCYNCKRVPERSGFRAFAKCHNEDAMKYIVAFCVMFSRHEINSVPKELQYEMFRTTKYEQYQRNLNNTWMDMAVIDSVTYFLFLRYKILFSVGRNTKKALLDLLTTTKKEPNLAHRETAMNIIGQCFEENGQINKALQCYLSSLRIRPDINAAKIHICRLLAEIANKSKT